MLNNATKILLFFFTAIIVLIPNAKIFAQQKKFKVVIDAGHGGHDSGTRGTKRMHKSEKDVSLAVAKLVAKKLKAYKDIKPILTRDKDVFLELYQRAKIANKNKADLFISIHCNANTNKSASGSETYVLGVHRNKDNLEVAKRENAVIELEADNKLHYKGFDPKHPETIIGLSLMQEEYLEQSITLASFIQREYRKRVSNIKDRSIQQAGFAVLRLTFMPSVLTEIGFLSNPKEEKFLHSKSGQDKIATAITKAIIRYKNYINYNTPGLQDKTGVKQNTDGISHSGGVQKKEHKEDKKHTTTKKTSHPTKNNHRNSQNSIPSSKVYKNVIFKVQLLASSKKIPLKPENFRGMRNLSMIKENGLYKYFSGHTSDFEKILEVKGEARYKSYKQAFIVAYVNGKRMPLSKILHKN